MPSTVPTPSINITQSRSSLAGSASSSFSGSFSASTSFRRQSLALGSFHSAQLRRPSFFAPFPYSQSPYQTDLGHAMMNDYSSSPRGGDVYERDLEANYCKNFSCCGLTLGDLHALLQHYEEAHVRFENDDDEDDDIFGIGFTDDDGWSTHSESTPNSPQMSKTLTTSSCSSSAAEAAAAATMAALTASSVIHSHPSFLGASKKKSAGVSLSDIYSEESGFIPDDPISAFPNSVLRSATSASANNYSLSAVVSSTAQAREVAASRKRDLSAFSSSFDAQSPLSKKTQTAQKFLSSTSTSTSTSTSSTTSPSQSSAALTAASILSDLQSKKSSDGPSSSQDELLATVTGYLEHAIQQGLLPNCGEVGSPAYMMAAEDLIRKRDEIVSMMESIGRPGVPGSDKPYRCTIDGCDKAYKNPNGLKYHNQHGHSSTLSANEDDKFNSRPYRCTFLDCGKCYKNLNGLKYHIEHSHPNLAAALHAHIPGFATLDGSNVSQAAIAAAAAIAAVQANPMMMAAASAIMASNRQSSHASSSSPPPSDHTPDSSPNSSPVLGPLRGLDTTLSSSVTPMTSPTFARAMLPNQGLSIQTSMANKDAGLGMMTPASLSPSSPTTRSPTHGSHVSTLTAALAAVTVQRELEQRQQQEQQHILSL
ncbi:Transcriptional regulator of ribosomal biogenesis proteins [Podila epigama]|nr:Transcriptional regulator of ribosomal biogenesis proteins [Podila epigama]